MISPISTRKHPLVRFLKDTRDGKDKSLLFVEGVKLAEEILASPLRIRQFVVTPSTETSTAPTLGRLRERGAEASSVSPEILDFVSDLESPPGLIVIAERPRCSLSQILGSTKNPLIVLMDGPQIPTNVGAIIRAAEAFGATCVIQRPGGADPFGPKALRAAAGSAFRLPIVVDTTLETAIRELKKMGVACVSADTRGRMPYREWNWSSPTALLLGSEAGSEHHGLETLRIPMRKPVDSLNVSVAAGILLGEAFYRREISPTGEKH